MEKPNWAPPWSCSNIIWFMRCWGQESKESTHTRHLPCPIPACPHHKWLSDLKWLKPRYGCNHIPCKYHKSATGWLPAAAWAGQALFWLELRPHHLGKEIQFLSSSNYSVIPMKNHLYYLCTPPCLTDTELHSGLCICDSWDPDASSLFLIGIRSLVLSPPPHPLNFTSLWSHARGYNQPCHPVLSPIGMHTCSLWHISLLLKKPKHTGNHQQ